MKKILFILIFALSLNASENNYETKELQVEGLVLNKLTLNVEDLQKMNSLKTGSTSIICMSGENKENVENYEGVKLKEILEKAQIEISSKRDFNKIYIIATASDNYKVLFSYQEIFNTKNGESIIVFYKKNGKLLHEDEGKIALVSMDDIKNGPRHIKWLNKIVVNKID